MSEGKNRPVGDLMAIVDPPDGGRGKGDFVQLAPVWRSESGGLNATLQSEPLAWRDPTVRRQLFIRLRDGLELRRVKPADGTTPPADGNDDDIPF